MKKWVILNKSKISHLKSQKSIDKILDILLKNRGIKTKKEVDGFLSPKLETVTIKNVEINPKDLDKTLKRIKIAIEEKQQIIVFGDYDVDGISGAAILWETLNSLGAKVLPYIPNRIEEGYGISLSSISNLKSQISNIKLIITVDNGIVANEAVDFANKNGIDVIITDHHVPSKLLPNAYSIIHTTKLCGAGVAYLLAQNIKYSKDDDHLELVALATIADLVPLTYANRTLVKFGLEKLKNTQRLGLISLFKEAGIDKDKIGVYEVGHIIAPRLNAMGRLESAMDSLRLICTTSGKRALELARKLSSTNLERQKFTQEAIMHASAAVNKRQLTKNIIFIAHENYQQGIIGLVAGKLVEQYYLPSIVVSKGKQYSKASARSISGLNIIEFIRSASDLLVDAGGHPMAAGFTVETIKLAKLQERFEDMALIKVTKQMLSRTLRIDCELPAEYITLDFYNLLLKLSPFGMANPIPVFVTKKMAVDDFRTIGQDNRHLKLKLKSKDKVFEAIGFGMGEKASKIKTGKLVDIVYTIDENVWNDKKSLQLKIKDIKLTIN